MNSTPRRALMLALPLVLGSALLGGVLLLQPSAAAPPVSEVASAPPATAPAHVVASEAPLLQPLSIPIGRQGSPVSSDTAPLLPGLALPGLSPEPVPVPPASVPFAPAPPPAPDAAPTGRSLEAASIGCGAFPVGKAIIINLAAQDLTSCQDGAAISNTLVTTGRPELPTPTGITSVLRKNSPWVMRSPWGSHSRFWYPPSRVSYVMWFREGGYGIHDAPWRDAYGPGTERHGSHGCVNVPRTAMEPLYRWADIGTPVQVV